MNAMSLPDFRGKVLLVYFQHRTSKENGIIVDPRFEMQGGRLFLLGNEIEDDSGANWLSGLPTALAWECVEQYFVFDSVEEYWRRAERGEPGDFTLES
jgi:hypothetical protein